MKQLWLPLLVDADNFVAQQGGGLFVPIATAEYKAFHDREKAMAFSKDLAVRHPQAKVMIFKAVGIIEPRKIEFAEKQYNDSGELIV